MRAEYDFSKAIKNPYLSNEQTVNTTKKSDKVSFTKCENVSFANCAPMLSEQSRYSSNTNQRISR